MAKLLDNLRGWYAASPPQVRERLGRLVGLLPADWKYGRTFSQTRADIARARNDTAWVEQKQLQMLRKLVAQAAKAPYYQGLFQQHFGGIPDIDHFTFDDLAKLPLLTKEALRNDPQAFLTKPLSEVDTASTSGSSGRPLTFYLDKDRGAREFAYICSFWERIGLDYRRHRRAVLRGVHFSDVDKRPWHYDAALRELRLSPFHLTAENMEFYLELMQRYQVDYLHGYPSSLIVLADYVIREKPPLPSTLKGILPVSEATWPHQIERFRQAFPQCRMTKYYGMSEKVLIAGQVGEDAECYDFEPLYGYGELVAPSGERITRSGESGHIVGTGFISMAMPLLRYDTEDVGDFVQAPSAKNGHRLRLRNIRGRWGEEYALGYRNELVSMSAINIHSEEYGKVHLFQLYQEKPGEVVLKVVPKAGVTAEMLEPFRQELQAKVGETLHFRLQLLEELPFTTDNGKRKFIDQRIDLKAYLGHQAA